jgi:natural product precursor
MKKLKLNQLAKESLENKTMNFVTGGGTPGTCRCGCGGPSSSEDNYSANNRSGHTITKGDGPETLCSSVHCAWA